MKTTRPARSRATVLLAALLGPGALHCAGSQPAPNSSVPASARASSSNLQSTSSIACQSDSECEVCHRAGGCGEPMAASNTELQGEACHVPPPAFCMPRRGHCDQGRCVAR